MWLKILIYYCLTNNTYNGKNYSYGVKINAELSYLIWISNISLV